MELLSFPFGFEVDSLADFVFDWDFDLTVDEAVEYAGGPTEGEK